MTVSLTRVVLTQLIILHSLVPLGAERIEPGQLATDKPGTKLRIVIVEGDGAINNIRQRTAREMIVRVEDENDRPVAGAVVVFRLTAGGPGGGFPGGRTSLSVITNEQGIGAAQGFWPNKEIGEFQVQVEATYQGQTEATVIRQSNVKGRVPSPPGHGKVLAIAAIAGGAAVGVILGVAGGGGNGNGRPAPNPIPTPNPTTTITVGGSNVGSPPRP